MRYLVMALVMSFALAGSAHAASKGACVIEESDVRVLFLGDHGFNTQQAMLALDSAGFNVTDGGIWYEWDGHSPYAGIHDVVVVYQGWEYGEYDEAFTADADQALTDYMLGGGTVVRMEWIVQNLGNTCGSQTDFNQYLPVCATSSNRYGDFNYGSYYEVTDSGSLTEGLPGSAFYDTSGCAEVTAKSGTVVVAESDLCGPGISYKAYGSEGGKVVHINSDFNECEASGVAPTPAPASANVEQMLINAVWFSME